VKLWGWFLLGVGVGLCRKVVGFVGLLVVVDVTQSPASGSNTRQSITKHTKYVIVLLRHDNDRICITYDTNHDVICVVLPRSKTSQNTKQSVTLDVIGCRSISYVVHGYTSYGWSYVVCMGRTFCHRWNTCVRCQQSQVQPVIHGITCTHVTQAVRQSISMFSLGFSISYRGATYAPWVMSMTMLGPSASASA
jgi:hypothetical protein